MQQNLERTEAVTQLTQIWRNFVKVKEIIFGEEKFLVVAHHPQQVCVFCSFFLNCLVSCRLIGCFIIVPFTPKVFVKSFFYSLLPSLKGAKAAINYSRSSAFKTDVSCVLFRSAENMRSNYIFTVVYSWRIVKKKKISLYCFLVLRKPIHWGKTSKRWSSDSKLLFSQTFINLKEAAQFNIFMIYNELGN